MPSLQLDLGARSYPINIAYQQMSLQDYAAFIEGSRVVIISNETVAPLYLDAMKAALPEDKQVDEIILPDGEQYKNLSSLESLYTRLLQLKADRKTTLVALGGGVIGDIVGFAAASYLRGVPFVQVPTTLLSMVDSSVGGKTGVNHALGKNMIGAFYQPQLVVIDTHTLTTLDDRQFSAGLAEIIKYALIRDADFFQWLETHMGALVARDQDLLSEAILHSCQHKAEVVAADETEAGQRALLNLGHTFGHAIENTAGYGEILHGEAVAIGMMMAARMSVLEGTLDALHLPRIKALLEQANLPTEKPQGLEANTLLEAMSVDKKVQDGQLNLILFDGFCQTSIQKNYQPQHIADVLQ